MMNKLKEVSLTTIISGAAGFLFGTLSTICSEWAKLFRGWIRDYRLLEQVPPELWLPTLLLFFVLSLVLACALYFSRRNRLHSKYGYYWDRQGNPYCPACKTLMKAFRREHPGNRYVTYCYKCRQKCYSDEPENPSGKIVRELNQTKH